MHFSRIFQLHKAIKDVYVCVYRVRSQIAAVNNGLAGNTASLAAPDVYVHEVSS